MRAGIIAALAGLLLAPAPLQAQTVNLIESLMEPGYYHSFTHDSARRYGHRVYETRVPPGVIAIIGVRRMSGSGNMDAELGTDLAAGSLARAQLSGIADRSATTDGNLPDVVTAPPGGRAETYFLHVYSVDNGPGEWQVRIAHFDIVEEFVTAFLSAGLQRAFECMLTDCSSNEPPSVQDEWVGRAIGLGIGAFQSGTVCSFGVRAVANEVQAKVAREYPDSRFLQYGVINLVSSLGAKYADVSC